MFSTVATLQSIPSWKLDGVTGASSTAGVGSGAGGTFGVNGVASGGSTGTFIASNCVYTLAYISLPINS